jgi:hypothetical protein
MTKVFAKSFSSVGLMLKVASNVIMVADPHKLTMCFWFNFMADLPFREVYLPRFQINLLDPRR